MSLTKTDLVHFTDDLLEKYFIPAKSVKNFEPLTTRDLSEAEQLKFAALLLEDDDKDIFSLYENNRYGEFVNILLEMLKSPSDSKKINFSEFTMNIMVDYYKKTMNELLYQFCSDKVHSYNGTQGYTNE
jgi:hypothetical protein